MPIGRAQALPRYQNGNARPPRSFSKASSFPLKSGTSNSGKVSGEQALTARTHRQNCLNPPSERSSRGVFHFVEQCRRIKQRLGGNTSPIQTRSAFFGFLNQDNLHIQPRRTQRRGISRGASPHNRQICRILHFRLLFYPYSLQHKKRAEKAIRL